jgi:glycosyltransferase involved in cell wall biosynthesis
VSNILFIGHSGYKGGAQYVLEHIVKHVCANNTFKEVHLIYPKTHGTNYMNLFKDFRVKVKPTFFFVSSVKLFHQLLLFALNIPSFFQIAQYVFRNKIDMIYINSSVNLMPLTLAFFLKRKTIFHIHENTNDLSRMTPAYTRWIYRWILNAKSIHTIFVSNTSKDLWEQDLKIEFNKNQSTVLYSPIKNISIPHAEYLDKDKLILGFVGSITKEKNIDIILQAIALIKSRNSQLNYSILICGGGPYKETLQEMATELNLNDDFHIMSAVDNVDLFFSKIDILIQPSINESWGLVALEAMIAQKPVIMTNRSGLKELFWDKVDCLYFDPLNPEDLSLLIETILSPDIQQKLVSNSYNKILNYHFNDKFNRKIDELLMIV